MPTPEQQAAAEADIRSAIAAAKPKQKQLVMFATYPGGKAVNIALPATDEAITEAAKLRLRPEKVEEE